MRIPIATLAGAMAVISASAAAQEMNHDGIGDTRIGGFADVGYRTLRPAGHSGFEFGALDLFISSQLAPKLSFLSEVAFERDEASGEIGVDIERLMISYQHDLHWRASVGRFHTPLGYFNSAYHHGAMLMPAIDRPTVMLFEDAKGILPLHNIGAMISGRDLGALHVALDVSLASPLEGNGTVGGAASTAVTAALRAEPLPDLVLGASAYVDRLSAGALTQRGDTTLTQPMDVRIGGGFMTYIRKSVELIVEAQRVQHATAAAGTTTSNGGYAYFGYRFGNLVPYIVHDFQTVDGKDSYFSAPDAHNTSLGLRHEVSAKAVLKLELRRVYLPSGKSTGEFASQLAIAF